MWLMALLDKFITAADVEHRWNHLVNWTKAFDCRKNKCSFFDILIRLIQQPSSNNPIVLVSRE